VESEPNSTKGVGWKEEIKNQFCLFGWKTNTVGHCASISKAEPRPAKSSKTAKENSRVGHAKEKSPVVRRLRQPRSTHESSGRQRWVASLYASGNVLFHLDFLGQLITCYIVSSWQMTCTITKFYRQATPLPKMLSDPWRFGDMPLLS
jgi:hypothetical protein